MKTSPIIRMTIAGETFEFSGEQIIEASLLEEFDPISAELPISTLTFRLFIPELTGSLEIFQIFNQEDEVLPEFVPVLAYEIAGGITLPLGKFYLTSKDSWRTVTEKDFHFIAEDLIGVLAITPFEGIFLENLTPISAVLSQVLAPFASSYELDDSLADVEVSGYIPKGYCREALKQVLLAAGASVSTARNTKMIISPFILPDKLYDEKLLTADKDQAQPIELAPRVTSIEVVSHTYTEGTGTEVVFEQYLLAGTHKIIFDAPYFNIVIDGPGYVPELLVTADGEFIVTADGESIEVGGEYAFGPNSIYLTMSEAGVVKITGTPWVDSKKSFFFHEEGEFITENSKTISDATLVNTGNVQAVLDRLRDYYRQRYYQNITIFPDKQVKPRDILLNNTLYGKKILGQVRRVEADLTSGFFAVTDVFGIQPAYTLPMANPFRRPRCGVAVIGTGIMRQNGWREYA